MRGVFRSAGQAMKSLIHMIIGSNGENPLKGIICKQKLEYLHNNPVEAGLVKSLELWQYSFVQIIMEPIKVLKNYSTWNKKADAVYKELQAKRWRQPGSIANY